MRIEVCDVTARDGLQNELLVLDPAVRAELVNRVAQSGVSRVEVTSFVSPARVPQMADAEEVVAGIERRDGVVYAGLVLNERGYDRLLASRLDELHVAFACTDTFNLRNQGMTVEESLSVIATIAARARRDGIRTAVTIGSSFGCPFEGPVDPGRVLDLAERLVSNGADEISFADTIGVAVPGQVSRLVSSSISLGTPIGVHLHNTRNTGIANAWAAVEAGATILDGSVGGVGGCPFAPRAGGNIATEDLVYMLDGEGVQTGVAIDVLIAAAQWLEQVLARELDGKVYRAGPFVPVTA